MKTPVLPILVGLSLCGIGGAMLYSYFKSKDESLENEQITCTKNGTTSTATVAEKEITHEIILSNDVAPIIVGRNLSNLKLMEDESAAKIWFKDKNDGNQMCYIKGTLSAVTKAEELIKKTIQRTNRVTEDIFVPQTACGKITGRCGDSLQEICRKSKAKVSVESGDRGDGKSRRITITGNQSQVNIAKLLIEEKVKEDAEARKLIEEVEAKREPRGGVRTPTGLTPATSRESLPPKSEKLSSTSSDGQLEVYVSAIASPARFWLQLVGPQSSDLDILVDTMTEYYDKPEYRGLHKIKEPYLGQIVAAMFKYDSKWYRAEVISILPNDFRPGEVVLDLYFVDYGDSEYVGPHEICELRTDFLKLRFQAIECYLAHVQPAIGMDPDIWDESSISRFEELTHVAQWKKMLSRTVTYKERTKGDTRIRREGSPVPGIELYDSSEGRDINVADELVAEGYAVYTAEAQQARNHSFSFDSPENSPSSSMYENQSKGHNSIRTNNHNYDTNSTEHNSRDTNENNLVNNGVLSPVTDYDKFSAIYENTTNENYENIQRDSSNLILDSERINGNVGLNGNVVSQAKHFSKDWNEMIEEERSGLA